MTDRVYAGELRAMGVKTIPEHIPDCAWVPRSALEWKYRAVSASGDQLSLDMTLAIHEPFKWVEVNAIVERLPGAEGGV